MLHWNISQISDFSWSGTLFFINCFLVLNRAQSLQKDWLQLHAKVSQRLTSLVEAHRLASEEFWLPLSNFQGDLIALRRSADTVISGRASRLPLEPSTYASQIEALQNIQKQHEDSGERLNVLRGVGNKIIALLIDEAARSEGEKSILKKEINNAIQEVSAIAQNITTTCEQQLVAAKDHLATAQKLQVRLTISFLPFLKFLIQFQVLITSD